ncbi:MAG: glycosyltransferase [Deltaproteobacteria bacterium]|nr:glycosyltransferase [Deltaproteobacteria bacterium]
MSDPHFLILYVVRDRVRSLKGLFGALSRQTYKDWQATFIDDGSSDDTPKELRRLSQMFGLERRVRIIESPEPRGAAAHVWEQLAPFGARLTPPAEGEVSHVLLMGARFKLAEPTSLATLAEAHQEGWAVAWGPWRDAQGRASEDSALHPFEPIRRQPWVFSGPFSFEARYARVMTARDLQGEGGRFFDLGAGQAVGYAVCEATVKRRALREALFETDQDEPPPYRAGLWREERVPPDLQRALSHLGRRPSKEPRVDPRFFQEHLYAFMEMAFIAERQLTRRDVSFAPAAALAGAYPPRPSGEGEPPLDDELAGEDLSPKERRERLLLMDIEDVEMLAEAGDHAQALTFFQDLAKHAPDSARVQTNIGVLLWGKEEPQTAMKHFMLAIRYDRDNRDPVMNCAGAWVELGRLDQAMSICKDFLSRHPADEPVRSLLRELESLA